ncbi:cytochrome b-c1 complex subunit Rieske: mitochondrial-like protein [Dinothrombium tinctorium]|uniref:Cytochrome b-c1 complex subunit Rieske: mitochondrial-like protein n=1 Tax=Dinothrombium tinctorium TaxID=1965070 RepID=A0A3S3NRH9_9ACAR|nr:cytochrome b-c1 complex subunit Rieske: mitochondrial-like protein [Dinothrombium tinctorium]
MDGLSVHVLSKPNQPQMMAVLKNPFEIKLSDECLASRDGLQNGIKVTVKAERSFWLLHFWGVDINTLHNCLRLNWQSMKTEIFEGSFLENVVLSKSEIEMFDIQGETEKEIVIKPLKELTPQDLGESPRSRYPLVVLLIRNEDDTDRELQDEDVVVMVNIIHVRDSICQMETSIISQLLKQRNSNIFNLQTLFTPDENSEKMPLCVVCQDVVISRALLPCRHACVCGKCYDKLDKCPLCRSYIHSYFKIRDENATKEDSKEESNVEPDSTTNKPNFFRKISTKLNTWLGFN